MGPKSESPQQRRVLSGGMLELDIEDILEIIPHRPPLLLVDRVLSLVPGAHAVGIRTVTGNEGGLAAHRQGFVFPSTFALEALVQLASLTLLYPGRDDLRYELRAVHKLDINQEMASGDRIYLTVSVHPLDAGNYRINGDVQLAGENFVTAVFDIGEQAVD